MNQKKILLYILLSNLLIVFSAGHAALPLVLLEPILVVRVINYKMIDFITIFFLLLGQVACLVSYKNGNAKLGIVSVFFLFIAITFTYYSLPERINLTYYSAIPFFVLSIIYFGSVLRGSGG